MEKTSIFKLSGIPEAFAVVVLVFLFILLLSPYLSEVNFGVFMIPTFTPITKKWFKIVGPLLFIACIVCFVPLVYAKRPTLSPPAPNEKDLAFDQLLYDADEHVHKPFEQWLRSKPSRPSDYDAGSQIATHALQLATKIAAFNTEELGSYRATKAMAKHEYLAMLHCWALAIVSKCKHKLPAHDSQVEPLARRVLAEYDTVSAMRRELFARGTQPDPDSPLLRQVAEGIENVTSWYAARAACILYDLGSYPSGEAHRLAQLAHDLFPEESDPWMDKVRNMKTDISPK